MTELTRRQLLAGATVYGGAAWIALQWPHTARAAKETGSALVLTAGEWRAVDAAAARILPTEEGSPGAREAGCVNFIDKALANEEAAALPSYRAGLRALDLVANRHGGQPFAELGVADQDAVLTALEAGNAAGWPSDIDPSPGFFETLRVHTIIGFLADPRYGGNRDFAGWKHVGYPGPSHARGGYTKEQMLGQAPIRAVWEEDV
jgi:gluconate 2-dehydrogenase gamma chain